ncbi:MAG: hypothetical protein A2157_00410 [Deltaproteobacteria bacterium RBG_16_47_11]|nr:MAG: hypothetical protein A2157_00410 [Deltaproteobacteria bacterium RBG_16_47_11]
MVWSYRWKADDVPRCTYIPVDQDLCPGKISARLHCQTQEDCLKSGRSIFTVSFPGMTRETTEK